MRNTDSHVSHENKSYLSECVLLNALVWSELGGDTELLEIVMQK